MKFNVAVELYTQGKYKEAFDMFLEECDPTDVDVQHNIGYLYLVGEGVTQDSIKAAEWFLKAAKQGDADAQGLLAEMYECGNGVEKNIDIANNWLAKSAENGNSVSQWKLGYRYLVGEGVDKNLEKAYDSFVKSAQQGNDIGQFYAGDICRLGFKKYEEAAKWYRLSAENGNPHSQCFLGVLYYWGQESKRIYQKP